jgi:FixJ family two-component response regulator
MSSEGKKLTPHQNDKLTGIVRGLSNKQIAHEREIIR